MTWDVGLAGGIFLVAYALIASERFDRTLVALLGGLLVVALGVIGRRRPSRRSTSTSSSSWRG
jgi:Na+/H+ antiporter NhaD/arsenite permease-like protein